MQATTGNSSEKAQEGALSANGAGDEQPPSGKKILLLGGSNAGLRNGWAAQLVARAGAHVVDNSFLGAVGSLYGLMALLKLRREGAALPEVVVFEYCLNDIILVEAGVLGEPLIVDALREIVDFCADAGVALLFLCLEPRATERRNAHKARARVRPLYAAAAQRAGASCLWLHEIFANAPAAEYLDENHLTPAASSRVTDAVLAAIDAGVATPRRGPHEASRFDYVDATQARAAGPCVLRRVTKRIFSGPFFEIARGGSSFWPGNGRLVGLMLLSTEASGVYLIRTRDKAFRKNARSQMQEEVVNLLLLHYTTRSIVVAGEVEVAMPDDEVALMREAEDKTLLDLPATAPFAAQTLEIHGVMFWRPRSMQERLRAFFRAAIKASGWRSAAAE